jgi:hypothetical protein
MREKVGSVGAPKMYRCSETPSLLESMHRPRETGDYKENWSLAKYPPVLIANTPQTPTQRRGGTEDMAKGDAATGGDLEI